MRLTHAHVPKPPGTECCRTVTLQLEDSVPMRTRLNQVRLQDLEVYVTLGEDGQVQQRAWAYVEGAGPIFAPVTINAGSWDGDQLNLEMTISIPHLWPQRTGGDVTLTLSAEQKGDAYSVIINSRQMA